MVRLPNRPTQFHSLLLHANHERIVLADRAHPSKPLRLGGEEVMGHGYWMVWFLYKGQPWDIARFYRPDGTWTGYYVDVLETVRWEGANPATLQPLVDLFLDVWIAPDGNTLVLDEDEFQAAISGGVVTASQQEHARTVLSDLLARIQEGSFPPVDVRRFAL